MHSLAIAPERSVNEPSPFRVLHSSYGRLRLRPERWTRRAAEQFVGRVQDIHGVSSATASNITENVLLLYDPQQIDRAALLAEATDAWGQARQHALDAAPVVVRPTPPVANGSLRAPPVPSRIQTVYVTGIRRTLYKIFGWTSVGLAVVGAILPGIPTAPFVILAGYFFIRSSPTAHEWLRQSHWFGPMLRDWEEHHGVRRSVRNVALLLIGFSMIFVVLMGLPLTLTSIILVSQLIGLAIVLRLRVVDQPPSDVALIAP
jgi:uncharacterized membrane protein YbaN (DUF454 family)